MGATGKCNSAAWLSDWKKETMAIFNKCKIAAALADCKNEKKAIIKAVTNWFHEDQEPQLLGKSLVCLPQYPWAEKRREYIDGTEGATALALFRLGDVGMGNRDTNPLRKCLLCSNGENKESHLAFSCSAMSDFINETCPLLQSARDRAIRLDDPDRKLRRFLGEDLCDLDTLKQRGRELALLLKSFEVKRQAFIESTNLI